MCSINCYGVTFPNIDKNSTIKDMENNPVNLIFRHIIKTLDFEMYKEMVIKPMGILPLPFTNKEFYVKWMLSMARYREDIMMLWIMLE